MHLIDNAACRVQYVKALTSICTNQIIKEI
jgi:hypothetical protein